MDLPCPIKQQGNNAILLPIQPLGETLEDSRASKKVSKPFSPPNGTLEDSRASKKVSKPFSPLKGDP
jgi:hypothetical protein